MWNYTVLKVLKHETTNQKILMARGVVEEIRVADGDKRVIRVTSATTAAKATTTWEGSSGRRYRGASENFKVYHDVIVFVNEVFCGQEMVWTLNWQTFGLWDGDWLVTPSPFPKSRIRWGRATWYSPTNRIPKGMTAFSKLKKIMSIVGWLLQPD